MGKKTITIILALLIMCAYIIPAAAVDDSQKFAFILSEVTQGQNVTAEVGDVIVIELHINRTDLPENTTYHLNAMQDEVYYDTAYLKLDKDTATLVENFNKCGGG